MNISAGNFASWGGGRVRPGEGGAAAFRAKGQAGCAREHLGTAAGSLNYIFCVTVLAVTFPDSDGAGLPGGWDTLALGGPRTSVSQEA